MFLEYYGLREQPFGVTPDPRFLYFGATHREALASLFYGIESGCGFLALIAPPGMGKTTLLFHLLEKLRGSAQTVFLFQTQCGSREMFRHLLNDLGIDSGEQDLAAMHESLNSVLLSNARKGRRVVLVIDEAQNLKDSVLETVRLLSDFETPQSKLLQIVLSGQPQLADKLSQPGLIQLRQRISVISRLNPLTRVETMVYLEYRLCKAGYSGPPLFSYAAADLIAAGSKGIPRTINNLCFNAMTLGFAKRQKQIDAATVREVITDLDLEGLSTHRSTGPELTEDSLCSFDGISPSNELTYQDFHDAVRAAWGNGAPLKTDGRPAQDSPKWTGPNSMPRPVEAIVRMSLHTEETAKTAFELDRPREVGNASSGSVPIPPASPSELTGPVNPQAPPQQHGNQNEQRPARVAAGEEVRPPGTSRTPEPQAAQLEIKNASHGSSVEPAMHSSSPQAIENVLRKKTFDPNSFLTSSPSKPGIIQRRGREVILSTWTAVLRTWLSMYKKGAAAANKGRAVRGGTVVAVAFALTASGLLVTWGQREYMPTSLKGVLMAPSQGSMAPAQASAAIPASQSSEIPQGKLSPAQAMSQYRPIVVTLEQGQTLGQVSLHYLGQFNPKVTREIQMFNPKISNPNLIFAGTEIRLPSPSGRLDISPPSAGDVLNRAEE